MKDVVDVIRPNAHQNHMAPAPLGIHKARQIIRIIRVQVELAASNTTYYTVSILFLTIRLVLTSGERQLVGEER
jgi:hypothetical protein